MNVIDPILAIAETGNCCLLVSSIISESTASLREGIKFKN